MYCCPPRYAYCGAFGADGLSMRLVSYRQNRREEMFIVRSVLELKKDVAVESGRDCKKCGEDFRNLAAPRVKVSFRVNFVTGRSTKICLHSPPSPIFQFYSYHLCSLVHIVSTAFSTSPWPIILISRRWGHPSALRRLVSRLNSTRLPPPYRDHADMWQLFNPTWRI